MPHRDVVIVGAGAIGSSIAYHLGKRGMRSVVVERESIGTRASGKAWAVIPYPQKSIAEAISRQNPAAAGTPEGSRADGWHDLVASSYQRMPDLALDIAERGGVDIEYGESLHTLLLTEKEVDEKGQDEMLAPYRQAGAIETGWLDAHQLRDVFPSLHPKWVAGITSPQGQVEPYKYTLGLAQSAECLGALVKQGEAVGFAMQGDRITGLKLLSGELLEADHFVIAAGPWSRALASHLGVDVPMLTIMAECIRVSLPTGLPFQTLEAGDYWIIPKVNGEVILSAYEGSASRRDDFNDSLTEALKLKTVSECLEILPALEEAELVEHRGDLLALTSMSMEKPTLGRLPEWENGYLATHFGGTGILMSPAAGELMAELIVTGQPPLRAAQMFARLAPPG
ncbi:MAG: FAD-binding oxidoreductase [bacterium]|nr:FAD-binding oxidoreductase [bacterium]